MKRGAIAAARRAFGTQPLRIALRAARPIDYGFARQLCFAAMRDLVEQVFGWDEYSQDAIFARQFVLSEVRIVTLDSKDIGWIQTQSNDRTINFGQFCIAPERRGRGIGGAVLKQILAAARKSGKDVTLSVMKGDHALGFYLRRGFRLTHDDRYRFYLRFEPKHPLRGIGPSMGMRRG